MIEGIQVVLLFTATFAFIALAMVAVPLGVPALVAALFRRDYAHALAGAAIGGYIGSVLGAGLGIAGLVAMMLMRGDNPRAIDQGVLIGWMTFPPGALIGALLGWRRARRAKAA